MRVSATYRLFNAVSERRMGVAPCRSFHPLSPLFAHEPLKITKIGTDKIKPHLFAYKIHTPLENESLFYRFFRKLEDDHPRYILMRNPVFNGKGFSATFCLSKELLPDSKKEEGTEDPENLIREIINSIAEGVGISISWPALHEDCPETDKSEVKDCRPKCV